MEVTKVIIGADATFADVVRRAAAPESSPLIWLVDANASPRKDALQRLLNFAPRPAASLPVDPGDRPIGALLRGVVATDLEQTLSAIKERALPLLHIHPTSILVPRDQIAALPPPDPRRFGRYAGMEWTSRLFRHQPGFLVPASKVQIAEFHGGSPLELLRVARAVKWGWGETIRELQRRLTDRSGWAG